MTPSELAQSSKTNNKDHLLEPSPVNNAPLLWFQRAKKERKIRVRSTTIHSAWDSNPQPQD